MVPVFIIFILLFMRNKIRHCIPISNKIEKSDKVATQLKARGDLIGLGFDRFRIWFNIIRDWFRFRIGSSLKWYVNSH